ncbi:MAG: HlyC/CorC family transporter, partial [Phycisphaerales bacterium]|nr:HlyC/CorC family transporter [Phycisphaerales bacterium]
MMIWIALIAALLGACYATLNASLRRVSRVRLEQHLVSVGRPNRAAPIFDDYEAHVTALAMARAIFTVVFVLFVLLEAVFLAGPELHDMGDRVFVWSTELTWALVLLFAWMLVFGTAIPGSIANHAAVPIIAITIPLIRLTRIVSTPVLSPLRAVDAVIKRLAGEHANEADDIDEQIMSVVSEGEREGKVDEAEKDMIEGVVELRDTTVDAIMTPRIDVEGIELTDDLDAIKAFFAEAGHSRVPVYEDDLDHIVGMLYVKDLIPYIGTSGDGFQLKDVLREPNYIPESKPIHDLLTEAQETNIHIAIVVDEYGGTAGLVTIEDVLEEIVGEIRDEYESEEDHEPQIVMIDNRTADVDARVSIDDLNDEMLDDLGCAVPEDEDYDTVGGFVFAQLGHVPEPDESFMFGRLRITISEAEKTRVCRVRLEVAGRDDADDLPSDIREEAA